MQLREFHYLREPIVDSLLEQLGIEGVVRSKKSSKFGLSLAGPSIEIAAEQDRRALTLSEKLSVLANKLQAERMITFSRPSTGSGSEGSPNNILVWERCRAKKLILPCASKLQNAGLRSIAVWISDPNPMDLFGPDWIYRGSFLFLTELHFDTSFTGIVYSGCSALNFIANAAANLPFLTCDGSESLGRGSAEHPIEKLKNLGAVVGDEREIETFYKIRYMTNEQRYTYNGQDHRVHDILGYPIFIATSLSSGDYRR
jgi:hypothetical protein